MTVAGGCTGRPTRSSTDTAPASCSSPRTPAASPAHAPCSSSCTATRRESSGPAGRPSTRHVPGPGRTAGRGSRVAGRPARAARWPRALAAMGDAAAAVLAAEAVGAAERALERTVEYVRRREQFGRPIGSFQAVKHRLADVYVQVQAARSAAYYAAWAAGSGSGSGRAASPSPRRWKRCAPPRRGRPAARRHRLHLGARGPPLLQARAGDELLFGPVHRLRARAADAAELFDPSRRRRPDGDHLECDFCRRSRRPAPSPASPRMSSPRWTAPCTGSPGERCCSARRCCRGSS